MSKPLSPLLALYKMNTGVCPLDLVFGVHGRHGVFCADRLPVSSSVFLAYVYRLAKWPHLFVIKLVVECLYSLHYVFMTTS